VCDLGCAALDVDGDGRYATGLEIDARDLERIRAAWSRAVK
jgi:hypothetical protein